MSETNNKDKDDKPAKKLSLGGKGTLSLGGGGGGAGAGAARSNPNTISVEVRRSKRTSSIHSAPASESRPQSRTSAPSRDRVLSSAQREARAKALEAAKANEGKDTSSMPKRVTLEDAKRKKDAERAAKLAELEELTKLQEERKNAAPAQEERASAPGAAPKQFRNADTVSYTHLTLPTICSV